MRFFTAREGCGGLGAILVPDRVAAMSFALVFDIDCARRLRASGDSKGDEGVPKSGLVNVTPGELGERGPSLLLTLPPPLSLLLLLLAGVELSERNCSWLAARTPWTLAAQSSRSYNLCSNNLNVNG